MNYASMYRYKLPCRRQSKGESGSWSMLEVMVVIGIIPLCLGRMGSWENSMQSICFDGSGNCIGNPLPFLPLPVFVFVSLGSM